MHFKIIIIINLSKTYCIDF